jgi:hypothetical protein
VTDRSVLPTFLIIGAMKCGTSSLWNFIRGHPQVYMPPKKEIEFFSRRDNWERGVAWYSAHFRPASMDEIARGEASTAYSKYPQFKNVPERIASVCPNVRFIYLVREPIERMRSHWEHVVRSWGEKRPLDQALLEDRRYLDVSRYATQLERYLEFFDRSRILVLQTERLRRDRDAVCRRVFEFLDVDPQWRLPERAEEMMVSSERRRDVRTGALRSRSPIVREVLARFPEPPKRAYRKIATAWRPPERPRVSPDVAGRLREDLRSEVVRLREFMDDDFDGWGIG